MKFSGRRYFIISSDTCWFVHEALAENLLRYASRMDGCQELEIPFLISNTLANMLQELLKSVFARFDNITFIGDNAGQYLYGQFLELG